MFSTLNSIKNKKTFWTVVSVVSISILTGFVLTNSHETTRDKAGEVNRVAGDANTSAHTIGAKSAHTTIDSAHSHSSHNHNHPAAATANNKGQYPAVHHIDFEITVDRGFDDVFEAVSGVLASMNMIPNRLDKKRGVIGVEKQKIKATTAEVDCGTFSGVPYVEDNRTEVFSQHAFFVRPNGSKQTVIVIRSIFRAYFFEGGIDQPGSPTDKAKFLKCRSKGVIEKKLLDDLRGLL